MSKAKTDSNIATRDFKDEGTGKVFAKGKPVEAEPGELENYRAAGLLGGTDEAATTEIDTNKADPAKKPNA